MDKARIVIGIVSLLMMFTLVGCNNENNNMENNGMNEGVENSGEKEILDNNEEKEDTENNNSKFTENEILTTLGLDFTNQLTYDYHENFRSSINEEGTQLIIENENEFVDEMKEMKINLVGFSGKVKSLIYIPGQLAYYGDLKILSEDGKVYTYSNSNEEYDIDDFSIPSEFRLEELNLPNKVESMAVLNNQNNIIIYQYEDGTYVNFVHKYVDGAYREILEQSNLENYMVNHLLCGEYRVTDLTEESKQSLNIKEILDLEIYENPDDTDYMLRMTLSSINTMNIKNVSSTGNEIEFEYENNTINIPKDEQSEESLLNQFEKFEYSIDTETKGVILKGIIAENGDIVTFEKK